jgi:DNA polymerase I-like protein with 3'-5' exonuclease and polymerase domains
VPKTNGVILEIPSPIDGGGASRVYLEPEELPGGASLGGLPRSSIKKNLGNPRRRNNSSYVSDDHALRTALARNPSAPVAVDLETKGLHPHASEEAAIGAVIVEAAGVKYIFRELPQWWPELLEDASTPKILHNAKFDLSWMIEHCPSPNGQIYARNIQDTMLKSQLVHDYRTKSGAAKAGRPELWDGNDLQSVLQEFLGVEIKKAIDHEQTDWTGPWSSEMIEYMVEDIGYLTSLNQTLDNQLLQQGQERASWIEQDAVFATAWMGVNGIKPDVSLWLDSIEDWRTQHLEHLKKLVIEWPGVENYNSPKQLVESSARVLGAKLPDTKKATLKQLSEFSPAVATLLQQRHLATRLKNWGPHYLENYVCGLCHRFHPGWNQIGTETSRPSCWKPNILQIPRAAEFRALFVADEGNLIASLDYSAIEVLVAGVFAQEPRLIDACATGDPHLATAKMISGDQSMTKADPRRQNAKIANFGLLFGGGAAGLVKQARDLFDTHISLGEAEKIIQQYYRLYPGLRRTKNLAYEALNSEEDRVTVSNAVGFRRYLEGFNRKPTSWLNTWIQSTAAYGMKSSFRYLMEAGLTPFVLGQVYDEVLFEFPEEDAYDFAQEAQRCMIRGMQDVIGRTVPVTVSIDIGRTWS